LIKLEADLLDMAGLFLAEQIAGAANVEIMRGKLESCGVIFCCAGSVNSA